MGHSEQVLHAFAEREVTLSSQWRELIPQGRVAQGLSFVLYLDSARPESATEGLSLIAFAIFDHFLDRKIHCQKKSVLNEKWLIPQTMLRHLWNCRCVAQTTRKCFCSSLLSTIWIFEKFTKLVSDSVGFSLFYNRSLARLSKHLKPVWICFVSGLTLDAFASVTWLWAKAVLTFLSCQVRLPSSPTGPWTSLTQRYQLSVHNMRAAISYVIHTPPQAWVICFSISWVPFFVWKKCIAARSRSFLDVWSHYLCTRVQLAALWDEPPKPKWVWPQNKHVLGINRCFVIVRSVWRQASL